MTSIIAPGIRRVREGGLVNLFVKCHMAGSAGALHDHLEQRGWVVLRLDDRTRLQVICSAQEDQTAEAAIMDWWTEWLGGEEVTQ